MLLSSLCLLLFPSLAAAAGRPNQCLDSGDETAINAVFSRGGKGAIAQLCPGSVHRLNSSILFTAARQTLTTAGDPKDRTRAMIIVEGPDQAVAIKADCPACGQASVRSVIVDGNRPQLLRVPKGGALIEMGNAEGQEVRDCRLYEPRGWSALHFREGDRLHCRKAHVADNEIGPCGEEWDDDYDGFTEDEPPWGFPRSDGISLACKDSLVERNTITDATDGAIVVFGSAGTEVKDNNIYARTRVTLGGINLVDYPPWEGDYASVQVHHNHIHAYSRFVKVGIVIGPASWSDDTDSIVRGATVTDNTFDGAYFGYGIVVSSAQDFTVLRNVVDNSARFGGVKGRGCPKAPENGKPSPFLINRGSATGTFQQEFINGEVQHIICINPPALNGEPYKPWRFRDSPEAAVARAQAQALDNPEQTILSSGVDARLAEALVNYQLHLLTAMDKITDKIERANRPVAEGDDSDPHQVGGASGEGQGQSVLRGPSEVQELDKKMREVERGEKRLRKELDTVQSELDELTKKVVKGLGENRPIIESVFRSVAGLKVTSPPPSQPVGAPGAAKGHDAEADDEGIEVPLGSLGVLVGSGAVLWAGVTIIKRWRHSVATSPRKGMKSV